MEVFCPGELVFDISWGTLSLINQESWAGKGIVSRATSSVQGRQPPS